MAKEAGWTGIYTQWAEPTGKPDWTPFKYSLTVPVTMEQIQRFAALVAAKERERIFGAGRQLDGQMRLQLTRWEDGECFAAAAHFSSEQTHCGSDDLLTNAVERLDDSLDACIAEAIRARGTKEGV